MRIGINALLCSPSSSYRNAGVSRYIREIVTAMTYLDDIPETHLFLAGTDHEGLADRCVPHYCSPVAEKPAVRVAWEQFRLPVLIKNLGLDVLHSPVHALPAVCPCASVVTIHDLSFMHFPQNFPKAQGCYLRLATARAVRKADAVIAVSESTRRDVINVLGVPENKVYAIPNGIDPAFKPASDEERERIAEQYGVGPRTVLYLGTLEPRKNLPTLLRAFHKTKDRLEDGHNLVLAGGKGWFYDELFKLVEELGLTESVHFTGYVPDADLPALYSSAGVFVYPSLYEGFGFPPLEAMACGTPVITSNTSSLPEVVGDAGITLDPYDVDGLTDAIVTVLTDSKLRTEMSCRGLRRASDFSWQAAARRTLEVYGKVYTPVPGS